MKHIVTATELPDEWLQPDPVAKADAQCPEGYKALFAYGSKRRATTSAFKSVNPVDWVLTPYTYYVNWTENLIWLTQEIALLGVEEGRFSGLVNPVAPYPLVYVSNLNVDGTTLVTDNCNGWSSTTNVFSKHYGVGFYSDESYLDAGVLECGYSVAFYCVEQ